MKNFVQEGKTLSLLAPYAVASGAGFQVGRIFAVATGTAANGAAVEGAVEGVYTLAKTDEQAWTVGVPIYWDDTAKEATIVGTGRLLIGYAVETVAVTAGLVAGKVRLAGAPYPQAAHVADASAGNAAEINALRNALRLVGIIAPAP